MTRDKINAIGLSVGLTSRLQTETEADLSEYLYAFAQEIYAEGQRAMQERAENACRVVKVHIDGYHLFTANKVRGECSLAVQRLMEVMS